MKKNLIIILAAATLSLYAAEISDLTAEYRNGQVFLQWQEKGLSSETRLTVWGSSSPITRKNYRSAQKLAEHLNSGSARDWWRDISSFLIRKNKTLKNEEIFAGKRASASSRKLKDQGFVLSNSGKPIPPDGGLHVHTPLAKNETGKRYYAVTCTFEDQTIGFTTLENPIAVKMAQPQAIQISGRKMPRGCGKGRPLLIYLHGRGGGAGVDSKGRPLGTHLFFTDRTLGWREGLPFKFTVNLRSKPNMVTVSFYDRVWIGREMVKGEYSDSRDRVKAISTFWMGYNPNIGKSIRGPEFKCDNYTERLLLRLIDWIQDHYQTDPAAVYISGGSMGGTGAVQLATHFPERFAAVSAKVPIFSYTWKRSQVGGFTSVFRMHCSVGRFTQKNPATMPDGTELLKYLDGAANIAKPGIDFPPIFACSGRRDQSMPWANNPPFFAAAGRAKQFLSVYWDNGAHNMTYKVPADMKKELSVQSLFRFRLDRSYPVFSNCSDDKNPGNGDVKDGDIIGWINRGISWQTLDDKPEKYLIDLKINHPDIRYPVTADITIRRRQKFLPNRNERVKVKINGKAAADIQLDKSGALTVPQVTFSGPDKVKIELLKK